LEKKKQHNPVPNFVGRENLVSIGRAVRPHPRRFPFGSEEIRETVINLVDNGVDRPIRISRACEGVSLMKARAIPVSGTVCGSTRVARSAIDGVGAPGRALVLPKGLD
jgi:hypothetical protein